jgi:predicted nucleic acid-binding protein
VIFVDTGFLYALVDERDQNHQRVIGVIDEYRNQDLENFGLTTNHVVDETITLIRKRAHRDRGVAHDIAVEVGQKLYDGVFGRVHHVTPSEERKAFEYFARHKDKVYSMTDCVSFVIMDAYKITEALTVDADFTHRFVARPGPLRR